MTTLNAQQGLSPSELMARLNGAYSGQYYDPASGLTYENTADTYQNSPGFSYRSYRAGPDG